MKTCMIGIHQRVLVGGGMMQDAYLCVDCGRDKYPESFGIARRILPWPNMIDESPEGREREWKKAVELHRKIA